jgi:hypothetical protein
MTAYVSPRPGYKINSTKKPRMGKRCQPEYRSQPTRGSHSYRRLYCQTTSRGEIELFFPERMHAACVFYTEVGVKVHKNPFLIIISHK